MSRRRHPSQDRAWWRPPFGDYYRYERPPDDLHAFRPIYRRILVVAAAAFLVLLLVIAIATAITS